MPGKSFLGDRLRALLNVYKSESATQSDLLVPLAAWVEQVLQQARFQGGIQQDAAECLMHILATVDGGAMQRRVCGANAAASVENMILCSVDSDVQVSREGPALNMARFENLCHRERERVRERERERGRDTERTTERTLQLQHDWFIFSVPTERPTLESHMMVVPLTDHF